MYASRCTGVQDRLRSGHLQEIRSRISLAVEREPRKRVWRVTTLIILSLPPSNSLEAAVPSICIAGDDEIDVEIKKSPNPPWKRIGKPDPGSGEGVFKSIIRTSISNPARPAGHSLWMPLHISYLTLHITSIRLARDEPKILVPNFFR